MTKHDSHQGHTLPRFDLAQHAAEAGMTTEECRAALLGLQDTGAITVTIETVKKPSGRGYRLVEYVSVRINAPTFFDTANLKHSPAWKAKGGQA